MSKYILIWLLLINVNVSKFYADTNFPSGQPSGLPSGMPSGIPSNFPTSLPTYQDFNVVINVTTTLDILCEDPFQSCRYKNSSIEPCSLRCALEFCMNSLPWTKLKRNSICNIDLPSDTIFTDSSLGAGILSTSVEDGLNRQIRIRGKEGSKIVSDGLGGRFIRIQTNNLGTIQFEFENFTISGFSAPTRTGIILLSGPSIDQGQGYDSYQFKNIHFTQLGSGNSIIISQDIYHIYIHNCTFSELTSPAAVTDVIGIGLYLSSTSSDLHTEILITNSLFLSNTLEMDLQVDAAVVILKKLSYFEINNCIFSNNYRLTALKLLADIDGVVKNSQFDSNFGVKGSGIFVDSPGNNIHILQCQFRDNHASLSAGGIYIASGSSSFIIKNSVFYNNSAANNGGAVLIEYENMVSITDSLFEASSVFNGNGGAVATQDRVQLAVTNSLFRSNCAQILDTSTVDGSIGNGGALYTGAEGGQLQIEGTMFFGNTAGWDGGCVYVENALSPLSFIRHSILSSNVAANDGAAVLLLSSDEFFTFEHSSFHNNTSGNGGAVVCTEFANFLTIDNCSFTLNVGGLQGGALAFYNFFEGLQLKNSYFSGNVAMERGGAISITHDAFNATIQNTTFTRNTAGILGGGVFLGETSDSISFQACIFNSNVAVQGGGLYVSHMNQNLYISDSLFSSNYVLSNGGGVNFDLLNRNVQIVNNQFLKNYASTDGGAVEIDFSNTKFSVLGNIFKGNEAVMNGGGLDIAAGNTEILLLKNTFTANVASKGGGMALESLNVLGAGRGLIRDCSFLGNIASSGGGGMYTYQLNIISITSCLFVNNTVKGTSGALDGGAILSVDENVIAVALTTFRMNSAHGLGGAVFLGENHASPTFRNCSFIENKGASCGAMSVAGSNVKSLLVEKSFFVSNSASEGGAVCLTGSVGASLIASQFHNNSATARNGGSIVANGTTGLLIESCIFTGCHAGNEGGALFITTDSNSTISRSEFVDNTAKLGGGIYVTTGAMSSKDVTDSVPNNIRRNTFTGNIATVGGACVFWEVYQHKSIKFAGEPRELSTNSYSNNNARWGPFVATQSVGLNTSRTSFVSVVSGHALPRFFTRIVDYYNQTIITTAPAYLTADTNSNEHCFGTGFIKGQKIASIGSDCLADVTFSNLQPICKPGQQMDFTLQATISSSQSSNQAIIDNAKVSFLTCKTGEFFTGEYSCVRCYNGSYSLEDNSDLSVTECVSCSSVTGVEACSANILHLERGFWRAAPTAKTIIPCPLGKRSCLGGTGTDAEICAKGYTGPICAVCAHGYRLSGLGRECGPCDKKDALTSLLIVLLVIICLFVLWKLFDLGAERFHIDVKDILFASRSGGVMEVAGNPGLFYRLGYYLMMFAKFLFQLLKRFPLSSMELKVLFSTTQIFSNFVNMLEVGFTEPFRSFIAFFGWINFSFLDRVGLGCKYKFDHVTILQITTLVPIGIAACLFLGHVISKALIERRGVLRNFDVSRMLAMRRAQYTTLFLMLIYLVLPGVSIIIFRSFSCINSDPDEVTGKYSKYLRADLSIACNSDRYRLSVGWAAVSIAIYPVGVPVMYFILLHQVKTRIREEAYIRIEQEDRSFNSTSAATIEDNLHQLRFLYSAYKPLRWYWEIVETVRRIVLTGILAILLSGSTGQIILGMVLTIVFIKLYTIYEPYRHYGLQLFAEICMYGEFLILFGAFIIKTNILGDFTNHDVGVSIGMLIAALLPFLVVAIILLYRKDALEGDQTNRHAELVLFDLTEAEHRRVESVILRITASRQKQGLRELSFKHLNNMIYAAAVNATDNKSESVANEIREIRKRQEHQHGSLANGHTEVDEVVEPRKVNDGDLDVNDEKDDDDDDDQSNISLLNLWAMGELAESSITDQELTELITIINGNAVNAREIIRPQQHQSNDGYTLRPR